MELKVGDKVEMKKAHPCGSNIWEVARIGADIKIKCLGCGHEVMKPRVKVEKGIKKIINSEK
ncbi:MAG: DUF951 domain-containing protein [Lachnospiraceae bacterium]|nr:DUF951 domain-containing protein [Lachnospiraceae bacterium]